MNNIGNIIVCLSRITLYASILTLYSYNMQYACCKTQLSYSVARRYEYLIFNDFNFLFTI